MSHSQSPKTPLSPEGFNSSPPQDRDQDSCKEDYNSDEDEYFKPLKRLRMMHIDNNNSLNNTSSAPPTPPPASSAAPSGPLVMGLAAGPNNPVVANKPLTSFSIRDILSYKPKRTPSEPARIVRPWDLGGDSDRRRPRSADDDSRSESDCPESPSGNTGVANNSSPLDALFEMTSKAFEGLNGGEHSSGKKCICCCCC